VQRLSLFSPAERSKNIHSPEKSSTQPWPLGRDEAGGGYPVQGLGLAGDNEVRENVRIRCPPAVPTSRFLDHIYSLPDNRSVVLDGSSAIPETREAGINSRDGGMGIALRIM
jgi:hypothetical protein